MNTFKKITKWVGGSFLLLVIASLVHAQYIKPPILNEYEAETTANNIIGLFVDYSCKEAPADKGVEWLCDHGGKPLLKLIHTVHTEEQRMMEEDGSAGREMVSADVMERSEFLLSCFSTDNDLRTKACIEAAYNPAKRDAYAKRLEPVVKPQPQVTQQPKPVSAAESNEYKMDVVVGYWMKMSPHCANYAHRVTSLRNTYGTNSSEVLQMFKRAVNDGCSLN